MLTGIKALLSSEKAIAAGLLAITATVLAALGRMTIAEWREYTLWVLGIYTGGKTATSVTAMITGTEKPGTKAAPPGIATSPDPAPSAATGVTTGEIQTKE